MRKHLSVFLSAGHLVLFLLVSFLLPLFSFEGYSWRMHTTSHLGAQGSPHAWIMNLVFVLLGIRAVQVTRVSPVPWVRVFGILFGGSLLLTGVFRHAPLAGGVPVDTLQDAMHSVFATATGFAFALLAFAHGVVNRGPQRTAAFLLVCIAALVPLLMMRFPLGMGISQRIMFLCAFSWLFLFFRPASSGRSG